MWVRLACLLLIIGGLGARWSNERPLISYRTEGRDGAIGDLPSDGSVGGGADDETWYRLAKENHLVGKSLDDAIAVYGKNYLIVSWGRSSEHRAYYSLAGTRSWHIYGVLVLDDHLRITEVITDPH